MKKTVGIIDADLLDNGTRHPNLALMKLSGYYKNKGFEVKLLTDYLDVLNFDLVFVSKVFSFTKIHPIIHASKHIKIGGTGFFSDGGKSLDEEIEHHMPDYDLYNDYISEKIKQGRKLQYFSDYLDYSIGFTTRGCFRKCEFCVNKKYDKVQKHSPIPEFLDNTRTGIYLWDDNFLGYENWYDILNELEAIGKPFQFRQGLDIRLLDVKMAEKLSRVKYHGDFIFAFDYLKDKPIIENKLALWRKYYKKTTKLYVLCAYESQDEKDIISTFERIKVLMRFGCLPYIMRYESYKQSKFKGLYTQIARWCNQPRFFKKKTFREFCFANQEYHSNKKTLCASYKAMIDFEEMFPEIAKEYFDLRFENEKVHGGY